MKALWGKIKEKFFTFIAYCKGNIVTCSKNFDFSLFVIVLILLGFGAMMIFSASAATSFTESSSSFSKIKSQIVFTGIAVAGFLFFAFLTDTRMYSKLAIVIMVGSLGLLGLVLVIGRTINYAKRWIYIGSISIQPSEIFKLAVIIFVSYVISRNDYTKITGKFRSFFKTFLYIVPVAFGLFLIALQPHISCVIIICVILISLMLFGKEKGRNILILIAIAAVLLVAIGLILWSSGKNPFEYIGKRIATFFGKGSEDDQYQVKQSLIAIGSGGMFGKGFGRSVQKYLYLPEPYNDFVFSILAEELGFVGVFFVIVLFMMLIFRCINISARAKDKFSAMIALGITVHISIQVFLNLLVVGGWFPVTGISLPFFSYGGTSLIFTMSEMGIMMSISAHQDKTREFVVYRKKKDKNKETKFGKFVSKICLPFRKKH